MRILLTPFVFIRVHLWFQSAPPAAGNLLCLRIASPRLPIPGGDDDVFLFCT